jgi:hypothetical protein
MSNFMNLGRLVVATWRAIGEQPADQSADLSAPQVVPAAPQVASYRPGQLSEAREELADLREELAQAGEELADLRETGEELANLREAVANWATATAGEADRHLPYEFRGAIARKLADLREILGNEFGG